MFFEIFWSNRRVKTGKVEESLNPAEQLVGHAERFGVPRLAQMERKVSDKQRPKMSGSPARSAEKRRKKINAWRKQCRKWENEEILRKKRAAERAAREERLAQQDQLGTVILDVFGVTSMFDPGRRGRLAQAARDLERRIRSHPHDCELRFHRGIALMALERQEEAITELTEAIRLRPSPRYFYERSSCLGACGRLAEAIADCTGAIQLAPQKAAPYFLRGRWFLMQKEYERAIADWSEAIRLSDGVLRVPPLYNRAVALRVLKRLDQAIADLNEVLRLEPDNLKARQLRGKCYEEIEAWQAALEDFEAALEVERTEEYVLHRAWCLEMLGEIEEAIEAYGEAIALFPEKATSYAARGSCLIQMGRYEEAAADLYQAVEHSPEDANFWLSLSSCLSITGRLDEALTAARQAVRYYPQGKLHRQNLISVLRELGREREADGEQGILNGMN